jgi:acetylornithine deacetylase/succinyl-diaminopimelate desuccinylase-like protein
MSDANTGLTVELLQTLIRNECVNEGTMESGHEVRNADVLQTYLEGAGLAVERFEAAPGRVSVVAKIEGTDPSAPSLLFNGHTDVVPVNPDGWDNDPFGGELIDGEIWGRGAVDMLNLTSSMAVATRLVASRKKRLRGDLIFFAVADEENGSKYGARFMGENHPDAIRADYVLTENGGLHSQGGHGHTITVNVGEKGIGWNRLTVRGTPGHGSTPYKSDNALMKAAAVIQRIGEFQSPAKMHELWRGQVDSMPYDAETKAGLLDPLMIDETIASLPKAAGASFLHACTHTTFSPNVVQSQHKTNVIPDTVHIDVDSRTMPGDGHEEVKAYLREAMGELADHVEIEPILNEPSSMSPMGNPLWDSLQKAVNNPYPDARIDPGFVVGFTDARVHRELGAVTYGAGLFGESLTKAEYRSRFHGNNERIDVESLGLTTQLWLDVIDDLLG